MTSSAKRGGAHVYVMVGRGACKIGVSLSPKLRLLGVARSAGAAPSLAYATERRLDCYMVEKRAHGLLSAAALGREWFSVTPDVAIDAVRAAETQVDLEWSTKTDVRYGSAIAGQRIYSDGGRIFTRIPSADAVRRWVSRGGAPQQYRLLVSNLEALPPKDWPERWRRQKPEK